MTADCTSSLSRSELRGGKADSLSIEVSWRWIALGHSECQAGRCMRSGTGIEEAPIPTPPPHSRFRKRSSDDVHRSPSTATPASRCSLQTEPAGPGVSWIDLDGDGRTIS
jgi:hypothetical protein